MSKEIDFTDPKNTDTLTTGLNHYSATFGFPESKKWSLDFLKKNFPDEAERLAGVAPEQFSNRGYVCRMMHRGLQIPQETKDSLIKFFKEISTEPKPVEEVDSVEQKIRKKAKVMTTNSVIYQLEDVQDAILTDQEPKPVTVPADTAVVTEAKVWIEKEVMDVSEQIVKFKAMLTALEDVYGRCGGVVKGLKRKPAKPAKPAKVVKIEKIKAKVEAVKTSSYLKDCLELNLTSVSPIEVIGAKRLFAFDMSCNVGFLYIALDGQTLNLKSSKVENIDLNLSRAKKIADPAKFFPSKDAMGDFIKLETKSWQPRIMLNAKTLLLAVA
jgi:hypothetical protein